MNCRGDEDFTHFETDADGNKVEFQVRKTQLSITFYQFII